MVPVEFVYEKIRAYPLIDKLYRNYPIYRNSSGAKKATVCKIFTPVYTTVRMRQGDKKMIPLTF